MAIFIAWLWTAQLMYEQIFGGWVPASPEEFARQVLTTPAGRRLIIVGNSVGFLFAVVVLAISVVSFPMLVARKVSAATAVRTSVRAVLENPVTMAMWGLFIAGALLFYLLLFRTRLVPRFLSVWGLIASVMLLVITGLGLAGIKSPILDALLMPMIGNEVVLAIWLMVKGFAK
jgi:hypothetical protein